MDSMSSISQLAAAAALVPVGQPAAVSPAAPDGRSGVAAPIIYLEIRRDEAIDRLVFEYHRGVDGDIVQRWPARQVVEFYQRMEALAARDSETGTAPAAADMGAPSAGPAAPAEPASDKGDASREGAAALVETAGPTVSALA